MSQKNTTKKNNHETITVYSIGYGEYADSGFMEKLANNENAIIHVVKNDDNISGVKEIQSVKVDFKKEEVYYTYKDFFNEIETGVLYLTKHELLIIKNV